MDLTNGLFECVGGILLILNCVKLYKDKIVQGVSMIPVVFFTSWGVWNLVYYPSLNQWWSFAGCIVVVCVNAFWIGQVWYYTSTAKRIT